MVVPTPEKRVAFGEWLRRKRRDLDLTQQQASAVCGVTLTQWLRWEKGKSRPAFDKIIPIARTLNLSAKTVADQAEYLLPEEMKRETDTEEKRREAAALRKQIEELRAQQETLQDRHSRLMAEINQKASEG